MELSLRRLLSLVQELYFASSPGALATVSIHLVTLTAVLKLFFLFPLRKRVLLPCLGFQPIIRPLSPSFTLTGDFFGLLYWPQYIPFFIHRVTECKHLLAFILTWICYFGREELNYSSYSSFNSQSLAACLFKQGSVGEISYFSPLSGRPRDNIYI